MGVENIRQQSFKGLRSIWLFFTLAFGLALVGHAFWLLTIATGSPRARLAGRRPERFLLWRKLTFRDYPRTSLPHGPSQNVIAVIARWHATRLFW
jgi:hypothetical protein